MQVLSDGGFFDENFDSIGGIELYDVTKIDDYEFAGLTELRKVIIINNSDLDCVIGEEAFENCPKLEMMQLKGKIIEIGDNAFKDCINLYSINIPDSVASIGGFAFCNCVELRDILIPPSTKVASNAFDGCTNFGVSILEELDYNFG